MFSREWLNMTNAPDQAPTGFRTPAPTVALDSSRRLVEIASGVVPRHLLVACPLVLPARRDTSLPGISSR